MKSCNLKLLDKIFLLSVTCAGANFVFGMALMFTGNIPVLQKLD